MTMTDSNGKATINITLDDLDARIQHDLDAHAKIHKAQESNKEKAEGWVYIFCLVLGAVLLIVHAFTDWIPFLVGLPSARVILTRWL
jgi:hypothetical protein